MMIRRTERSGIGEARWPFFLTLLLAVVVVAVPPIFGHAASLFTFYNALQSTACLGLIALGLGLTMIVGEFDLSVASTYALGGMLAVKFGGGSPIVGLLIGVGACVIFGLVQGFIVARWGINSMAITLGGSLVALGITGTLGDNKSQSYENYDVGVLLNNPIVGLFSLRSLTAIAMFALVFLLMNLTKLGRGMRATGGGRRASRTAGVRVDAIITGSFGASAGLAALGGVLQSFGTATATSNPGLFPLIFAVTACLLGGVGLTGGRGGAWGIACGSLTLALLSEFFSTLAAAQYVSSLVTGSMLILVTVGASPLIIRTWRESRARRTTAVPVPSAI
ncbi:MAG: ABC transporter permease [Actinomycetes bacterium]